MNINYILVIFFFFQYALNPHKTINHSLGWCCQVDTFSFRSPAVFELTSLPLSRSICSTVHHKSLSFHKTTAKTVFSIIFIPVPEGTFPLSSHLPFAFLHMPLNLLLWLFNSIMY